VIEQLRAEYPVSVLCRVLGVARSGYVAWRDPAPGEREQADAALLPVLRQAFVASEETYGSPRLLRDLRDAGFVVNHKHVERLMREHAIVPHPVRRARQRKRGTGQPPAPNRLNQQFSAEHPDQVWLVDSTEFLTHEGKLYLAVVEDLCSRRIVGWQTGTRFTTELVLAALHGALDQRRPDATSHTLLHHSDQGTQYASTAYLQLLEAHSLTASMSGAGNCYDNAPMESFFATLKKEWTHPATYRTRQQLTRDLDNFIEPFYNRRRRHSALGYISPAQFEAHYYQLQLRQKEEQHSLRSPQLNGSELPPA
jgi:transposase InsO family protein